MGGYDIIGSIAIVKFDRGIKKKEKLEQARKIIENHKNVKTVLEKTNKVSGRLRTIKTKHLLGKKTKETIHHESGCSFKLEVDSCYFSPRLSNERLEVSKMVYGNVLVLFAGVAPFSVVIAKNPRVKRVVSVELGRECNKYAKENVKLNKLVNKIELVQGDVNKVVPKLKEKFDCIVMPRPQLEDTFLNPVLKVANKNTKIIYYDFGKDAEEIIEKIQKENKNLKIENIKKAGEISPYAYRWRLDLIVLK